MAFHVGQRVVCIIQAHAGCEAIKRGASYPNKGDVVTIRAIDEFTPGKVILRFEEHFNENVDRTGWLDVEPGFPVRFFRPLSESRLDQFRAHLAPTPKERVPA